MLVQQRVHVLCGSGRPHPLATALVALFQPREQLAGLKEHSAYLQTAADRLVTRH